MNLVRIKDIADLVILRGYVVGTMLLMLWLYLKGIEIPKELAASSAGVTGWLLKRGEAA